MHDYVNVCIVFVYVSMHVYVHVSMHMLLTYMSVSMHVCPCLHTCVYVYMCVSMLVHASVYVSIHEYPCVCVYPCRCFQECLSMHLSLCLCTHLYKIVYVSTRVGRYHKNRDNTVRFYNITVLLNIMILSSSQNLIIVYTFKLLSHLSASKFTLKS